MSKIVFLAPGFEESNIRLQPWRYIKELAVAAKRRGNVVIVTTGDKDIDRSLWDEGFEVISTRFMGLRGLGKLRDLILREEPDELWWSTTPRSVIYYSLLKSVQCKKIGFITCPLYQWIDIFRAFRAEVPFEQVKVLLLQRLVPRPLFARFLNSDVYEHIFVQSEANKTVLIEAGVAPRKVRKIPVGIEENDVLPVDTDVMASVRAGLKGVDGKVLILYMGATRRIRGFDSLKSVFLKIRQAQKNAHLVVLARGASELEVETLNQEFLSRDAADAITVVGGWLSQQEVWAYIELCDIVVLPFILVPSDVPIAALEALARAKAVVVSNVDGLPELVDEGRGRVVRPTDAKQFEMVMLELLGQPEQRLKMGIAAKRYMQDYPRWDDVRCLVESVLEEASADHCE